MAMSVNQRSPFQISEYFEALYANPPGRVRVYGQLSPELSTPSGVRRLPSLPFPLQFGYGFDHAIFPTCFWLFGVELLPGGCLTDMEYADDIALHRFK